MATLIGQVSFAQNYQQYEPLKCVDPVPEELRTSSSAKYKKEIQTLANDDEGKAQKEFLLQSNFVLDEMMLSGKVLFNDPVSVYLTKVKDKILAGSPDLQKKIRVYAVKSPAVNAFATNSGAILVNLGLLAHLQNEAELAFILCHEIQHYVKQHPIKGYVNSYRLRKNERSVGLRSDSDYKSEKSRYSREQEQEADELGFELYRKSGYTIEAALGVFDVLGTAHLPYDQVPWEATTFEFDHLAFPIDFRKEKLDSIDRHEDEDDSLSTHPNIAKRRQALQAKIAEGGNADGETFLVGIQDFLEVRKRCRFELCEQFMASHDYEFALYTAYLLQAEEPESPYLQKVIAHSLYGLASHKNQKGFSAVHFPYQEGEGEMQQLLYFTGHCNNELLTLVALRQCWKIYLANPEDKELQRVAEDMLLQFFWLHSKTANWVAREVPKSVPSPVDSVLKIRMSPPTADTAKPAPVRHVVDTDTFPSGLPKNPRRSVPTLVTDEAMEADEAGDKQQDWYKWAICDLFSEQKFLEAWEKQRKVADKRRADEGKEAEKEWHNPLDGEHLGIDKIVLMQPTYRKVDLYKKVPIRYLESEEGLDEMRKTMMEMAKLNHIEAKFLESRNLQANQAEVINDLATASAWIGEHMNSEQVVDLENFQQDEADALAKKLGTPYIGWTGIVHVRRKLEPDEKLSLVIAGIIVYPLLPAVIVRSQFAINKTYFVMTVFDLRDGKTLMWDTRRIFGKDKPKFVRSTLYDFFYQIKSKPRKKKKK